MNWLEDHLEEVIERFAAEDDTTPELWKMGAIRSTASQRMTGSMLIQGFEFCDDWMELYREGNSR